MPDQTGNPHEGMIEVVADAAGQFDLISLDHIDRNDTHYKIIYAIDSNIFDLWLSPRRTSRRLPPRGANEEAAGAAIANQSASTDSLMSYGGVFRQDTPERRAAIASALGKFIWGPLSPDAPLLVVPPIDVEVDLLLAVAQRDTTTFRPRLERIERSIEAAADEQAARAESSDDPAPEPKSTLVLLGEMQSGDQKEARDAVIELGQTLESLNRARRMLRLSSSFRYLSVDRLSLHSAFPEAVQHVLRPFTDLEDLIRLSDAKSDWDAALRGGGRRGHDIRRNRDAEALARIELWNERLAELSPPHRIVYITSDSAVHTASDRIDRTLFASAPPEHPLRRAGMRTAFVRHPRSFLDRPTVLGDATRDESATSIRSWLRLLLGDFQDHDATLGSWVGGEYRLNADIQGVVAQAYDKQPDLPSEILESWGEFAIGAELIGFGDPLYLDEIQQLHNQGPHALRAFLDRWKTLIAEEFEGAWDDCVRVFTEARFLIGVVHAAEQPMRHAPLLCLEGKAAEAFLEDAVKWVRDPATFTVEAFAQHKEDVYRADPSSYHFVVVVAYILAQGQHWASAAFLCSHAMKIAERHKQLAGITPAGPNGREAAYLDAVSRRHLAKGSADLRVLPEILQESRELIEAEEEIDKSLDAVIERVEAERLAIRYSTLLFNWLETGGLDDSQLEALSKDYLALLSKLETRTYRGTIDRTEVVSSLTSRILLNLMSLGLLSPANPTLASGARLALSRPQNPRPSSYGKIVVSCATARFGEQPGRASAIREARHQLDVWGAQPRTSRGLPYDDLRMERFRKAVE